MFYLRMWTQRNIKSSVDSIYAYMNSMKRPNKFFFENYWKHLRGRGDHGMGQLTLVSPGTTSYSFSHFEPTYGYR